MTRELKEAIFRAAEESYHSKKYGGGLAGYLADLADERPDLYVKKLLTRLLPRQKEPDKTEAGRSANQTDSRLDDTS